MHALTLMMTGLIASGVQAPATTTFAASTPHLAVRAIAEPEVASPGADVTITFEVIPARRIHVYAPGSSYQVVAIKMLPQPGLKFRALPYPPSEIYHFEPLDEHVPVYTKPFSLTQFVTVGARALKGKERLTLSGTLEYQACDDRVCFRPSAIPFAFELKVKR